MDYMELLDQIIGNPYLVDYLHEGDTISPLFIGNDNGVPIHIFLVLAPVEDGFEPAYAIGLRSVTEAPVFAEAVSGEPFSQEELGSLPFEQYVELYLRALEAFGRGSHSCEDACALDRYYELLRHGAFQKWYTFLKQQLPDFILV